MILKIDIINLAYSLLRISGLTSNPTPEDISVALDRLEDMVQEFFGRNIDVGYNFEDTPDANSTSNTEPKHKYPLATNLAVRLMADFGKLPDQALITQQRAGYSFLSTDTAQLRETQYPSRMPRGSGSDLRYNRYQRFYRPQAEAPISTDTNKMFLDDMDDFVEHYESYLVDSETVSSYTITADNGLTVVSDSLSSPDISYRIRADGNSGEKPDGFLQIKIITTSSLGRILTRVINFELVEP